MNCGEQEKEQGGEEKEDEEGSGQLNKSEGRAGDARKRYNSGGAGHIARNCRKPKQESRGKGHGKGPKGGCFHCGVEHYASDCTKGQMQQQKGTTKGAYGMDRTKEWR